MKYFIFVITQMFNTSLIFLLDLVCVCVRFISKNKMLYYLVNNNIFLIFFVIKKKIAIYLIVMKRDRVSKSLWETLL